MLFAGEALLARNASSISALLYFFDCLALKLAGERAPVYA